ncbi:MAG: TerB family tellurite resistance protein [Acetobacteraceae bacterium]|nr:TerB family tellurite resistance protein [Acetobacteraceae bacterium]
MSIWGKILGGFTGFAMGGPIGAIVGAALGHAADQRGAPGGGMRPPGMAEAEIAALIGGKQGLFSIAVVILAAKVAKADGVVSRAEIDAFKRVFRIPPEQVRNIGTLFDEARESADGYEIWSRRLGEAFADQKGVLEDVLAALLQIAVADGGLHPRKQAMIEAIRREMRLSDAAWARARAGGSARPGADEPDPYTVLGIPARATDAMVREAWRNLVRENHPDALKAKGVPDQFVAQAHAKVARINAAWDRIKRERGL